MSSLPVALTIAGSDCSCGAGLQADLKTFAANGVYGVCAVSAIVAEAPGRVDAIHIIDSTLLHSQLNRVASSFPLSSVKTGMLGNAEIVRVAVDFIREHSELPLVVDPVICASTGTPLLDEDGLNLMKAELLPLARLITPNLSEAEILLKKSIRTDEDFFHAAQQIHDLYGCNVLLKGGHFLLNGAPDQIADYAWVDGQSFSSTRPRLNVPDVHGTGCTLSAAITARLARRENLHESIKNAISYMNASLQNYHHWENQNGCSEALNHSPSALDFL